MTRVTDMPCEVITAVFKQLDHIQFLLPCLLTCRYFYYSYKANPRSAIEILKQQVGPALLSYSIAVQEASLSPSSHVRLSTTELLKTLCNKPSILINRLRDYPLVALVQLGHTHDLVEKFANGLARFAWGQTNTRSLPRGRFPHPDRFSLSPTEEFRFYRAFYRVQLYMRLFRTDNTQIDQQVDMFFSGHSPWENEQLACVYQYLDYRISQSLYKACVTEEVIDVGDPIPGRYDSATQCLISQGLELIEKLEDAKSPEEKQSVFKSTLTASRLHVQGFQDELCDRFSGSKYGLHQNSRDPALDKDKEDRDKGPFTAWEAAITPLFEGDQNILNRRCAYVLWDLARIQKHDMLPLPHHPRWRLFEHEYWFYADLDFDIEYDR
ncbi:hypothetical protein EV127DRAFT_512996 [Xylaria flabelliformis]|nr:hypothetical protein EV127DRAFT_512996 [Xylaria flabelliformis]